MATTPPTLLSVIPLNRPNQPQSRADDAHQRSLNPQQRASPREPFERVRRHTDMKANPHLHAQEHRLPRRRQIETILDFWFLSLELYFGALLLFLLM